MQHTDVNGKGVPFMISCLSYAYNGGILERNEILFEVIRYLTEIEMLASTLPDFIVFLIFF